MKKQYIKGLGLAVLFSILSCKDKVSDKISEAEVQKNIVATVDAGKMPILEFDRVMHDFGTINEGDKVETTFTVTNKGDADLVIISGRGSCGCTVPEVPKNPIKPGTTAPIKVTFDSSGKPGDQEKSVTLTTNTASGIETCSIKAKVTPKKINN